MKRLLRRALGVSERIFDNQNSVVALHEREHDEANRAITKSWFF